jgi:hypothetical protein
MLRDNEVEQTTEGRAPHQRRGAPLGLWVFRQQAERIRIVPYT